MDPRLAAEVLAAVDTRQEQLQRARPFTAYGVVSAVNTTTRMATVKVSGDASGSGGFTYPEWLRPFVDDVVRVVIDPRGDRYIDQVYSKFLRAGTASVGGSFTSHGIRGTSGDGSSSGKWSKLFHGTMAAQFQDLGIVGSLIGWGDTGGRQRSAIVTINVKQQAAFGNDPGVEVTVLGDWPQDNVALVVTANTPATTYEFYVKATQTFETPRFLPFHLVESGDDNFVPDENPAWVASLPAGTVFTGFGARHPNALQPGGTAFPGVFATGHVFYRSDLKGWYVYDGTRWVSTHVETMTVGLGTAVAPFSASQNLYAPLPGADIWMEDVVCVTHCATPIDATNFWTITASKADGASANVTLGSAFNNQADADSTWTRHTIAVDAVVTAAYESFRIAAVKSAAPGNIYVNAAYRYRRIAT